MREKVTIITFCHRDYPVNYGQTLQGFALHETIKRLGYKVTTVSHKNRSLEQKRKYQKEFFFPDKKSVESRSFAKFTKFVRKNMKCIQSYDETMVSNIAQKSNILVSGSDAIWRTMHYDPAYYLNIDGCKEKLKLSYASSFANFVEKDINIYIKMGKMINEIHYISTREKEGERVLREICNCSDVETVLDPTLLFGKKNWEKYVPKIDLPKSYILLYLLDDTNKYDELIDKIKSKYQVNNVFAIFTGNKLKNRNYIEEGVGPDEFISWVKNAEAVITNSFHGTSFSLMFEREVYILKRFNRSLENDLRFKNITTICALEDRMVDLTTDIQKLQKIDYKVVNRKLELERDKSMLFLKKALNDEEKRVYSK